MDTLRIVYLSLFAAGANFALVSWVLGHLHGHGHAHGHGHGHAHGRGPPTGTNSGLLRAFAPLLNLSALAAASCAGGAAGYVAVASGAGLVASIVWAAAFGCGAGYLVGALTGWLARGSRYAERLEVEGLLVTVLQRIGARGTGEVMFVRNGSRCFLPARSADGTSIEPGTSVVVLEVERGIASVAADSRLFEEEHRHGHQG